MIEKRDILELGYIIKTNNMHPDNSTDFKHTNFKERPYLVHLTGNHKEIIIQFPLISKSPSKTFNKFSDFKNWHNAYI